MTPVCPSVVGSLVEIWRALHPGLRVTIASSDMNYLRRVVLAADDHLVAGLLAEKIQMTQAQSGPYDDCDVAKIGSVVRYSINDRRLEWRLMHGQRINGNSIGIGSRYGSALIGSHAGQSFMWPSQNGRLIEIRVDGVEQRSTDLTPNVVLCREVKNQCAFG
jgi:hypothetical protein